MFFPRIILTIIILSYSLTTPLLAASNVHATNAADTKLSNRSIDLDCENGLCSLILPALRNQSSSQLISTSAFVLQTLTENIHITSNREISLSDGLSLRTPIGVFDLFDADLAVELTSEMGIKRLHGMAQVPLPSLGIFDNDEMLSPTLAEVGIDIGSQLSHLRQDLVQEQPYLYFHLGNTNGFGDISEQAAKELNSKISIPAGQSLTLIVDLQRPQIYLDGNIALQNLSQLLLLSQFVGMNNGLPFQFIEESARMHITGSVSPEPEETFLRMDGFYRFDPQFLRNWFGSDTKANQIYGSMTIGAEGALFFGQVETAFLPEQVISGAMTLETFIPFDSSTQGYVDLGTDVELPALGITQSGVSQLNFQGINFAALTQPLQNLQRSTRPMFVIVKDRANDSLLFAARGYQHAKSYAAQSYRWSVDVVADAANQSADLADIGFQSTRAFAADSSIWLRNQAKFRMVQASGLLSSTYITATDFSTSSYRWASKQMMDGFDAATETAAAGYETAKDAVSDTYDEASSFVNETVIETASETYDSVSEAATAGYETAKNTVSDTYEEANTFINETVAETASETYDNASEFVDNGLEQTQDAASCLATQTQSLWCRTTGLCKPVSCEP